MTSPLYNGFFQPLGDLLSRRFAVHAFSMFCAFVFLLANTALTVETQAADLSVTPQEIVLQNAFARRQVLVESNGRDMTRQATYRSSHPEIATVDAKGCVQPQADGVETRKSSLNSPAAKPPFRFTSRVFPPSRRLTLATRSSRCSAALVVTPAAATAKPAGKTDLSFRYSDSTSSSIMMLLSNKLADAASFQALRTRA